MKVKFITTNDWATQNIKIKLGGCQACWEAESDEVWWETCKAMDNTIHAT